MLMLLLEGLHVKGLVGITCKITGLDSVVLVTSTISLMANISLLGNSTLLVLSLVSKRGFPKLELFVSTEVSIEKSTCLLALPSKPSCVLLPLLFGLK